MKSMFDHEAEYAQTHDDLPAKVYFTVGGYENPDGTGDGSSSSHPTIEPGWKPTQATRRKTSFGDTERMVTMLRGRAYPSLEIDHQVLLGEYHETAMPMNLSRSLRHLFGSPR